MDKNNKINKIENKKDKSTKKEKNNELESYIYLCILRIIWYINVTPTMSNNRSTIYPHTKKL